MNENPQVTQKQKEIFEEMAGTGIAHTLRALSKITRRGWKILDKKTKFSDIASAWKLFPLDEVLKFGGELVYSGEVPMSFVCIFPQKSVADLTGYINTDGSSEISDLQHMTIAEVSNILTNSFLGIIANKLKLSMLIAAPSVSVGSEGYLFKKAVSKAGVKEGYVLSSRLFMQSDDLKMDAFFVVILSSGSFRTLVDKIALLN